MTRANGKNTDWLHVRHLEEKNKIRHCEPCGKSSTVFSQCVAIGTFCFELVHVGDPRLWRVVLRVSPSDPARPHSRTRARTLRAPVSTFRRDGTLDDSRQGHLGRQDHARRRAVDHGGSAEIDALGRGQGERPRAAAASHLQGTRAEGRQDSRQLRYARSRGPRRRRHRVSSRAAQIPRRGRSFDRRRSEKKRKRSRGRTAADRARRPRTPNPDAPRPIARPRAQVSSPNTPSTS